MVDRQLKLSEITGKGFSYPFSIDVETGSVSNSSGIHDIVGCIVNILDVHFNEYMGNRGFGSGVDDLTFTINDHTRDSLFQHFISEAIEKWEPRVSLMGVQISREKASDGILEIGLDFYVLQTRESASMVYPFYVTN